MLALTPGFQIIALLFSFLYIYQRPDIETSDFLMASSVIVAPLKVGGAKLFQLIQISNFNDERSGRWHGLITDSFRQHFEIH